MLKWLAIHSRSPHSTNEERVHEEQRRLEFNDGTIMKNPAATEHHGKAEDSRGTNGHINTFSLQTDRNTPSSSSSSSWWRRTGLSSELCTVTGGFLLVLILF